MPLYGIIPYIYININIQIQYNTIVKTLSRKPYSCETYIIIFRKVLTLSSYLTHLEISYKPKLSGKLK